MTRSRVEWATVVTAPRSTERILRMSFREEIERLFAEYTASLRQILKSLRQIEQHEDRLENRHPMFAEALLAFLRKQHASAR